MDIKESKILLKDFQKGKIEKDKLEHYRGSYKMGYFYTVDIQQAIETVLSELEKKDEYIKMLTDEREHIKNNLKVDLKRKGVFSQAKGQIAQILEYYENNEKYFNKVEKEGIKE